MEENTKAQESVAKRNLSALWEGILYLSVFLFTILLFFLFKPLVETKYIRNGVVAQSFMALGIGGCVLFAAYLGMAKKLTTGMIVFLFLIAGFILRVGYMLYTPAATRQQDTYTPNFDGHEAYAWTIFSKGELPDNNIYQFYHPPLNAMMQAGFMHFTESLTALLCKIFPLGDYFPNAFTFGKSEYIDAERWFLYSSCQILCVTYSFITAVVTLKILKLFGFHGKTYLLLAAFVIFFPRNVQFSAMLNNDALSFLCSILALYFTLKWWKEGKKLLWILFAGLSVGCGMMAKFSSATVCLPIAGVFILEFVRTLKKKENALPIGKMIVQYGLFLVICAPIGLWFQIYAKIRFDQGLGYVFDNLNQALYTGHHSFFGRFVFAFDLSEYFGTIWCRPFNGNYNLFNYALRSSIFGEFSYWQGEGFAVLSIVLAYTVALFLFISLIFVCVKGWRDGDRSVPLWKRCKAQTILSFDDFFFVFLWMQSQVLSEVYFYLKMPYGCTMDFRYIMPIISAIALTLGFVYKALEKTDGKCAIVLKRVLTLSTIGFLTVSTLFYCVCI